MKRWFDRLMDRLIGREYSVQKIGMMSLRYFPHQDQAEAYARKQPSGDWVIKRIDKATRQWKRVAVIGGHFDDWPGDE